MVVVAVVATIGVKMDLPVLTVRWIIEVGPDVRPAGLIVVSGAQVP